MSYILKNTSGLVNTRVTDTGRQKLSQGNFNISYFQIGDSEVSYDKTPTGYNQSKSFILEPPFNTQNSAGVPQSNRQSVKYPYYVDGDSGNTYGIPYMDSVVESVFNRAPLRGFFGGITTGSTVDWKLLTNNKYVVSSNFVVDMSTLNGTNKIKLIYDACDIYNINEPSVGDIVTIYYDGFGSTNCGCSNYPIPTPTPSVSPTPVECWTTGFTLNVPGFDSNTIGYYFFGPTEFTRNGQPIFINENGFQISYNGTTWEFYAGKEGVTAFNSNQESPIGTWTGETPTEETITTTCGNSNFICGNGCSDFYGCITSTPITVINNSGQTGYFIGIVNPSEIYCNDNTWYLRTNGFDVAQLIGDCNTTPLGNWTSISSGLTSLVTSSGNCESTLECVCYTVSALTPGLVVNYLGCDGLYKTETIINSGDTIEICALKSDISIINNQDISDYGGLIFPQNGDCIITSGCTSTNCLTNNTYQTIYLETNPCASPTPTPTPSATPCLTPTPTRACPPLPDAKCEMDVYSCYPILTYRIVDVCQNEITLDRNTPDYSSFMLNCTARAVIYPPTMTSIYDSITPRPHWSDDVINFESVCDIDQFDVKVWNMNIPWTENPAGIISTIYEGYDKFGSIDYIGTKEYFGYNSSSGQTDTDYVYYYNSFGEIVEVKPEEQKAIAIIHYTNQTIDFFYGEKFALQPYNPSNPDDTTGQARNFKLHIPWLMWHKNTQCCFGETFWVDPPNFDDLDLFQVHYIESTKNDGMNQPGIRYYHLWDTHRNTNGVPSRIGKVFPDSKLVIIDDEEIIAAMSYKSNRNWTLAAPQISLITPNTCGVATTSIDGVLTGSNETMFVTYRLTNTGEFTNSLHSNYYSKISGNNNICNPDTSKNVAVRFGSEFKCLTQPTFSPTTTTTTFPITTTTTTFPTSNCYMLTEDLNILTTENGDGLVWCNNIQQLSVNDVPNLKQLDYYPINQYITTTTTICPTTCDVPNGFFATKLEILVQKVTTGQRPDSSSWKVIDFTDLISGETVNGYITEAALTGTTFVITKELYDSAPTYNLGDYITLTELGNQNPDLNFGDEYYFYGSIETDIQATIYEMNYKVNLNFTEFQNTSNPTWKKGTNSYITEIALLDDNKDIMVISKLQSPVLRQGIQQFVVKIDF